MVLACVVTALVIAMVGDDLNRTLVEMPAWRVVGPQAWAAFSRHADLGAGHTIYPVLGIGGTLLSLAAAIVFRLSPRRPLATAIPIYGWACANIGVMVLTVFAAPIMLSVPGLGNDPIALARAFAGFAYWDGVRAVVGAVGDCAAIWALVALLRPHAEAA
ncbi:MAG TPA: hypothetical protein VK679_05905 [Gemmatimonadaceae bacterium]|nr:hypothetical protein [Gemmatimonadaceae bacterium]